MKAYFFRLLFYIRVKETLTESQIRYLRRWTFGPFMWFVYTPSRQIWNEFLILLFLSIPLIYTIDIGFLFPFQPFIRTIAFYFRLFFLFFLSFIGRRLSWNRNHWKSFDAFQKSEKRWNYINILYILVILYSFYSWIRLYWYEGSEFFH